MAALASTLRPGLVLLLFLGVCFGVAFLGSLLTTPSIPTWYASLAKPPWNPPSWAFAPVWTTLYAMMAVSAWLVWHRAGWPGSARPLAYFAVQLALNLAWSALFFALRRPDLAFLDIVLLLIAIALTVRAFWPIHQVAAALLVPYLLWVSFAAALNLEIWRLNA